MPGIKLFSISLEDPLMDVILELEHLRGLRNLEATTPPFIFPQLKGIFHKLESLGSARIEGNRTTLAEYLEAEQGVPQPLQDQINEVTNIENALGFIDETMDFGAPISGAYIRELQRMVVTGLSKEGDDNAGSYRDHDVHITGSKHTPPVLTAVPGYMSELVDFINHDDPAKYDLIKVALAHHRFVWIHPFGNGNGRTVRLLTYAMLIKYGFNVGTAGRILNPTAVFCCDRNKYYDMLEDADSGELKAIHAWCQYVLEGILTEWKKLNFLTDYNQVKEKILNPALRGAFMAGRIDREEWDILQLAVNNQKITLNDATLLLKGTARQASYKLKKLKDAGLIESIPKSPRSYCLSLSSSKIIYGIVDALDKNGLIPATLITGKI